MIRFSSIFSMILMVVLFSACDTLVREVGNGNMITKEIEVDDFKEIIVSGNFEIMLIAGDKAGVSLTADENLHEFIEISTNGDRLVIETLANLDSDDGLSLYITYTQLTAIEIGGAATLESEETIDGEYLNISMSGAGALDLSLNLNALKLSVSGAGSVELSGRADEQNISMSGAGGLDAYELESKICKVQISGVGSANINVTEKLDASVSGVGGISYIGNPEEVTFQGWVVLANQEETINNYQDPLDPPPPKLPPPPEKLLLEEDDQPLPDPDPEEEANLVDAASNHFLPDPLLI